MKKPAGEAGFFLAWGIDNPVGVVIPFAMESTIPYPTTRVGYKSSPGRGENPKANYLDRRAIACAWPRGRNPLNNPRSSSSSIKT